jgi:hypothetical protein
LSTDVADAVSQPIHPEVVHPHVNEERNPSQLDGGGEGVVEVVQRVRAASKGGDLQQLQEIVPQSLWTVAASLDHAWPAAANGNHACQVEVARQHVESVGAHHQCVGAQLLYVGQSVEYQTVKSQPVEELVKGDHHERLLGDFLGNSLEDVFVVRRAHGHVLVLVFLHLQLMQGL